MPTLDYSFDELMSEDAFDEPLFGGEVLCHGGYVGGQYLSPRGRVRRPAIAAWTTALTESGGPLIHIRDTYVPPHYPNYEQSKLLLQEGIIAPVARSLTTISIVEGFGARIRELQLPDFGREVKESIEGTALLHLERGLIEAHARDEAGYRKQGGHKQMWEAARDIGLDRPEIPADVLLRMMSGGGARQRVRAFPALSARMEEMITFMATVLVVETFAEDVFGWAVRLLGDPEVSRNHVQAAHLVECIRADEKPHVDYLTVALSELRLRTLVAEDGSTEVSGAEVVDGIFARQLRGAATRRPREAREQLQQEIHELITDQDRAGLISRRFESLDSGWTFPVAADEQLDILLTAA